MIRCFKPDIGPEESTAALQVLSSKSLGFGPLVGDFEKAYGKLSKKKYNIGTNSASAAAYLLYQYLYEELGAHRVYTPSLGFVSPVFAAIKNKHKVILVDVDENLLMSTEDFNSKFIEDDHLPSVIMPVLYGGVSSVRDLVQSARARDCLVVLDSAHCSTPMIDHDFAFYSFHPAKPICMANGGLISTNDSDAADYFRSARNFGRKVVEDTYEINQSGFNFYMNNLNAAIGLVQIEKAKGNVAKRRKNFKKVSTTIPSTLGLFCHHDEHSSYYLCTLILKKGESSVRMRKYMLENGIECSFHYPPLHKTGYYKTSSSFNNLEALDDRVINLPIHQNLTDEEIDKIINECIHYSRSRR